MKEKIIVLVEDNPYDEALTREAFKANHFNHRIILAKDGEEALDILVNNPSAYNINYQEHEVIILLDLKLPKVNGLEVLKLIKQNSVTKLVPVIILTSSKEESDLLYGYSYWANSYIRKPVDFGEFVKVINLLGNYWLNLNESPPMITNDI